jgi:hypothetical protein
MQALSKEVAMKKLLLAGAALAVIAGSTAVYAQHRPWMHHHERINPAPMRVSPP